MLEHIAFWKDLVQISMGSIANVNDTFAFEAHILSKLVYLAMQHFKLICDCNFHFDDIPIAYTRIHLLKQ